MANKSIRRARMIHYFVDTATAIIQEEGISNITLRKVADRTGYNSATLYNYFKNLDHLVFLAALKCMEPYTTSLFQQLQSVDSSLEKNLKVWELFCLHSFKNPQIYEAIFFASFDQEDNSTYLAEYYSLFPPDTKDNDSTLSSMLAQPDIYQRNHILLQECVDEGFFNQEDVPAIDEITIFIYKGLLSKVLSNQEAFSPSEYTQTAMNYIRHCYKGFLCPEKTGFL
ncbi:TetR/AcrR family transcriptional regulator [Aminipila butyrica]|uniref:TetR/AcrR family transcriptional regulator n=1 Tax=Aminipila butyrica TaxID=433296 RepID=A0A858BS72_9FIRM|nr:TetR/AcrR family transcriptional regulator [Aminipila butyrica]QIB67898.1 TetR/AcrR family transcriptional regulator [Aminipila butyrica]